MNNSDDSGTFTIKIYIAAAVIAAAIGAVAKIVSNYFNGLRGRRLLTGVFGAAIGNAVNLVLLMRFARLGTKGMIYAALAAGMMQAICDFIERIVVTKKITWKQFTIEAITNTATTLAGNFIGARYINVNGNWIQPKYLRSFLIKSYGRKLIAQTGLGSIVATIIDIVKGKLNKLVR